jgi:hypothetical protein
MPNSEGEHLDGQHEEQVGNCPKTWHKGERVYTGRQASRVIQCLDVQTNKVLLVEQASIARKHKSHSVLNRFKHIMALHHDNLVCPTGARCRLEPKANPSTGEAPSQAHAHAQPNTKTHVFVDVFSPVPAGQVLSSLLAKHGAIDPLTSYAYILQVAAGINHLHAKGKSGIALFYT